MIDTATRNKLQFLNMIRVQHPGLYRAALSRSGARGLAGLGDVTTGSTGAPAVVTDATTGAPAVVTDATTTQSWWQSGLNSVLDTVKQLAPVYAASQQAKTCIDVNATRAKQGLSPVDCASSGLAPQVAVGVSPQVQTMGYVAMGLMAVGVLLIALKGGKRS